jgi:hypothetical protein
MHQLSLRSSKHTYHWVKETTPLPKLTKVVAKSSQVFLKNVQGLLFRVSAHALVVGRFFDVRAKDTSEQQRKEYPQFLEKGASSSKELGVWACNPPLMNKHPEKNKTSQNLCPSICYEIPLKIFFHTIRKRELIFQT